MREFRELNDLVSVGPATIKDLMQLRIARVPQLKGNDAVGLYDKLCKIMGAKHDHCVIDVFRAAIAQAENPSLEPEKCNWWYWTKVRKGEDRKNEDSRQRTLSF